MTQSGQSEVEKLRIRPYARLLTMLGEQLIKDDRVALVELLKNCYDADATLAKVVFSNFGEGLRAETYSTLILVDNGDGMSKSVVRDHWLNPATPVKAERKVTSPKTPKNRAIQGEKGIGRFAMFKLGNAATIVTRARGADTELVVDYDLSFLDEAGSTKQESTTFLDEIRLSLTERSPEVFDGTSLDGNQSEHGTQIVIRNLRSAWSERVAKNAFNDVARLQPLVPARDFEPPQPGDEFRVEFWENDAELPFRTDFDRRLSALFEDRAVLRVHGLFDGERGDLVLEVNGDVMSLGIHDSALAGLHVHKSYFGNRWDSCESRALACGPFSFSFFVFNLSGTSPTRFRLDSADKRLVKDHRIYLYRDGIRVLPYGDPQDDWLQLDVIRGTQGASRVLGNDQTVGFVHISHTGNPRLTDKTNREGLLDEGDAYSDFVAVLKTIAAYIRTKPYARYVDQKRRQQETALRQQTDVSLLIKTLEDNPALPTALQAAVNKIGRSYAAEFEYAKTRVERTEDLAGVGLSVESASHDILAAGERALHVARSIATYVEDRMPSNTHLRSQLGTLVELLSFVTSRLNDVQGLFVSTRQRRKSINVGDFAERVGRMFRFALEQAEIDFMITQPNGTLTIKSTEAAILQALVNLVDNAIYWVVLGGDPERRIVIQVEAPDRSVIVADTGPGVDAADAPFIFEPFYSGKGIDGKGLGLYIARHVGIRNGFDVTLSYPPVVLPGANFVVTFDEEHK